MRADHRGVQRLIAVRFGNGNIVFHPSRTRLIETVHLAEYAIAGIGVMNDDAESVNVHDRVKTLLFEHHFAVDRVKMFFATANATRNSRLLQTSFDFREDF